MGKPAREATIFALVGLLVGTLGMLVKVDADARVRARTEAAEAVHAKDYQLQGMEPSNATVVVTLENGPTLHVRQCPQFDPKTAYESASRMIAALETKARQSGASQPNYTARPGNDSTLVLREPGLSLPAKSDEALDCRNFSFTPADRATLERDYWKAYREGKDRALAEKVLGSLAMGLVGLPAGLGVWVLHRRVRLVASRRG